jgi:amino acid adenylation domain-containing protein
MTWNTEVDTVRDLIDRMASTQPDIAFLISPETGRVLTFKELQAQARHLYEQFRRMGLEYGDKIAFLMDNGLFTAQLFLGTMYQGLVSVPLNVRAGVSQLSYTLDHSDAKVIFVERQYNALIKEVMAHVRRRVDIISAEPDSFPELSDGPCIANAWPPVKAEDAALLMYTSGSTGQPKGAVHTHKSVLAHGRNSICSHQLAAEDRSLLVLPLYHINAECVTLVPMLMCGGSVVIPHGFVVSEFWNWLDKYRCTWSALVPTIISQLLDWKDRQAESRSAAQQRVRFLRTSSAPLSPSLHCEFLSKFKLLLIQAMGSSEAGNVFSNPLPPGSNKIGSPGLPWGFETKIVDREGAELPSGEPGEVLIRGDGMMRGYYKDRVGTAAALDAEGWLHTGDLAYRDEDGYFFVVGRSKELIIKAGMNIAPKQIDETLEAHPAILEAAAVGVPDRYVGEDLVAFVVLRDGMSCDERQLLSFCESRLGYFKTPTRIHFVQDLPKGPSGKVQRLRLMEDSQRPAAAGSFSLMGESKISGVVANGVQNARSAMDLLLEQIIAGIWSDLFGQAHIDSQSNFFALGGQSLLAIQCLSRLREKIPIILSLSDFFENPTVAQQVALVRKRLLDSPTQGTADGGQSRVDLQPIPLRDRTLPCPLSPSQERLWLMEQLIPGVPVYNEAEAVRLNGKLDVEVLGQALDAIVARHEILRTTIQVKDERPVAIVHENWPVKLKKFDLCHLPTGRREAELGRLLIDEPRHLYHLESEPGIRATLIQLFAGDHVFILMMHHIICDRLSVGILWRELGTLYGAFLRGQPSPLPPLPIQYGDYSTWQRQSIYQVHFEEDLSFWRENLRGAPALLDLPMDRPRPSIISYHGNKRQFCFDSALAKDSRHLCRQEQTSLFTIFAAALSALLYRYTGQDDILIGIPIADRDRRELQPLIGFLIDTHVLRTDLSGNPTFRELIARVHQGVMGVYSHRSVPFQQVVQTLQLERNLSYSPLFQVMLNWRDRDAKLQFIGFPGLALQPLLAQCKISKFDLTLFLTDGGDNVYLEMEYSTELFDDARIDRMVGHLRMLLEGAVANPDQRLGDLPLLTSTERHQLVKWNEVGGDYQREKCIHELFETQAERTPDAIAVACEGGRLTYRELNRSADELSHQLRALGVGPDVLVAIFLERSLDMVVGILAVLKSGGAYVPLDPSHPRKRVAYVLADAQPLVLLTHTQLQSKLLPHRSHAVLIDADAPMAVRLRHAPAANRGPTPTDLAYVIYTSGSTGHPKGVEIEHRAVVNMLASMQRQPGLGAEDSMLAITTLAFDIAVLEIFLPLSCGASIVIAASEIVNDGVALAGLIERCGASVLQATPTTLKMLLDAGWGGAPRLKILCGGEAWTAELANQLLPRCASLWNMYGPTETTVWSAVAKVEAGQAIVIGPPIANTKFYVLDSALQPAPVGVPGQLHIAGDGLARGYLHRPELTQESFVTDPFAAVSGARMYRTGDLVRRLPDGTLEFLGRLDHQVKIRGHRIELGEIEAALKRHPNVKHCVVIASQDGHGGRRLVAYVVPVPGSVTPWGELRLLLSETVPAYMIPAAFVSVSSLPLTPSGKLDRKALPSPDRMAHEVEVTSIAPRTPTEETMARLWCELLDQKKVGVRDNFFELGGNSLLAARAIGRINEILGVKLAISAIFLQPTIEALASSVERNRRAGNDGAQVISFQTGHSGPPLYFLAAGALEYRLAHLIGEHRAVFGIDLPMPTEWHRAIATADRAALPTVENLGELYGDVLRAHAGTSPCVVVGYSYWGKVAFEAARALQRAGGNVAFVLVIDAFARRGRLRSSGVTPKAASQSLLWIWRRAASGLANGTPYIDILCAALGDSWRALWWLLAQMPRLVQVRFRANPLADIVDNEGGLVERSVASTAYRAIGNSFRPRPLDASGVLIRARLPGEENLPGHKFFTLTNGWHNLFAQGLEIIQAAGDHFSLVSNDQYATALTRHINAVLDRYSLDKENRGGHRR